MRNSLIFSAGWILPCSQRQTDPRFFRWLDQGLECLRMNWSRSCMLLLGIIKLIGYTRVVDLHCRAKLMPSVTKMPLHGMGMLLSSQQQLCPVSHYLWDKLNFPSNPVLVILCPFLTERKSTASYSAILQPMLMVQLCRLYLGKLLSRVFKL